MTGNNDDTDQPLILSYLAQVNKLYSISFYTGNNNDTDQPLILSYLAQVIQALFNKVSMTGATYDRIKG